MALVIERVQSDVARSQDDLIYQFTLTVKQDGAEVVTESFSVAVNVMHGGEQAVARAELKKLVKERVDQLLERARNEIQVDTHLDEIDAELDAYLLALSK